MAYGPKGTSERMGAELRRRYESRTGKSYDEHLKVRSAVFWCAVTAVLACIAIWGLLRTLFG